MSQSRDEIAEQVVALAGSIGNEKAERMRELVAEARRKGAQASGSERPVIEECRLKKGERPAWFPNELLLDHVAAKAMQSTETPPNRACVDALTWHFAQAWKKAQPSGAPAPSVEEITRIVRDADQDFEGSGGSTRHWVRDCFLPALEKSGLRIVGAPAPASAQGEVCEKPDAASPVKPCPCFACWSESDGELNTSEVIDIDACRHVDTRKCLRAIECVRCGARGPAGMHENQYVGAWNRLWNRRTPAPSPATGESAKERGHYGSCPRVQAWDHGEYEAPCLCSESPLERALDCFANDGVAIRDADDIEAARAELASLRAEVDRLRTALAEKEKAGVDVERVEQAVRNAHYKWGLDSDDERSLLDCMCAALRTALGAKETRS